jgi:hypothetical protein
MVERAKFKYVGREMDLAEIDGGGVGGGGSENTRWSS